MKTVSIILLFASILTTASLTGCHDAKQRAKDKPFVTFLVGPHKGWNEKVYFRLRYIMPRKILELTPEQLTPKELEVNHFTFAVRYPSGSHVERNNLGAGDVVLITASWDPGDAVKQRVDGTWPNRLSGYKAPLKPQFGLNQFRRGETNDDSRLFVSDDQKLLIECPHPGNKYMNCRMMRNEGGYETVEVSFSHQLLPQWRNIASLSKRLLPSPVLIETRSP